VGQQPADGALEKHGRPFGSGPAQTVEPAAETEAYAGFGNVAVAVAGADLGDVIPALFARAVLRNPVGVLDVQLPGDKLQNRRRHRRRIGEEGAEETDGRELQGKSETVMAASAKPDLRQIVVGEMEKAGEFVRRRDRRIAAVAVAPGGGQEAGGHVGVLGRGGRFCFCENARLMAPGHAFWPGQPINRPRPSDRRGKRRKVYH